MIDYEKLPSYNLKLSEAVRFLNDNLGGEVYTNNIIRNYIKSGILMKTESGNKNGYTKVHLIQLIYISYMRDILKEAEISNIIKLLSFLYDNKNFILYEEIYKIIDNAVKLNDVSLQNIVSYIEKNTVSLFLNDGINKDEKEKIKLFILIICLIFQASNSKKLIISILPLNNE